jgi:glycosyltransferase involved in cell wall biosynthesis
VYFNGLDEPGLEGALLNAYPAMMFAHGYQGTCVSGQKCHAFPTFQPCGRRFGPKCLALYYPRRCGGLSPITALRMYSKQRQLNSWLSVYRAVLVGSKHMYEEYLQHGVPSEKLHLLRMPLVDSTPPATPPLPKTPKGHILFIGRLTNLKGVRYLIEAIPKAAGKLGRSLTLTVAGDGPARLELERFSRRQEVTSIFTGWIDAVQKSELMRRTDLLAVPSVWPEPFGLVGIEAGSLGVPAVGYSVGGVAEWLIPGQSGELAPGDPPTVDGLSDAIVRALADPAHYAELCLGAWEKSRSFSLDDHLDQLDTLFTIARQPGRHTPSDSLLAPP